MRILVPVSEALCFPSRYEKPTTSKRLERQRDFELKKLDIPRGLPQGPPTQSLPKEIESAHFGCSLDQLLQALRCPAIFFASGGFIHSRSRFLDSLARKERKPE